jgi:hypothetical protein
LEERLTVVVEAVVVVLWLPLEVRECRKGRREIRETESERFLEVLGFLGVE